LHYIFFFSSRRRHTRFSRDCSSDVCSSDLCVQDAIEEQIILHDFTRKAVLTWSNPAKKPEEKHLNYFETKKLLSVIYSLLEEGLGYYLILLGLTSGARFGELVGLTRKNFDFKNNTITINKTW